MSDDRTLTLSWLHGREIPGMKFLKKVVEGLHRISDKARHGNPLMSRQSSAWENMIEPTMDAVAPPAEAEEPRRADPRHEVTGLVNVFAR